MANMANMASYDYMRGLQAVQSIPPERRAIPNYTGLGASTGKLESARAIGSIQSSARISAANSQNQLDRQSYRMAKNQNRLGTVLGVAGVGAEYANYRKQKHEELKRKLEMEHEAHRNRLLIDAINRNIEAILSAQNMIYPESDLPSNPPSNTIDYYMNQVR